MEVVGAHHAHARELFDVAMAVDAARQHPAARGVDVARAGRELRRDFHDHAVAHADVGVEGAVCIADPAVADREVEGGVGRGEQKADRVRSTVALQVLRQPAELSRAGAGWAGWAGAEGEWAVHGMAIGTAGYGGNYSDAPSLCRVTL